MRILALDSSGLTASVAVVEDEQILFEYTMNYKKTHKPRIHVPTGDAMAYRMFGCSGLICPIMDARRNQVYTGIYRFEEKFETVKEQLAEDITVLAGMLNELGERVVFLGDGEHARDHKPDYLRMSQAERERLEREKEQQHDCP